MKTEERDDSSDFQRFLDSAAIALDELNDSNLRRQPIALQLFHVSTGPKFVLAPPLSPQSPIPTSITPSVLEYFEYYKYKYYVLNICC